MTDLDEEKEEEYWQFLAKNGIELLPSAPDEEVAAVKLKPSQRVEEGAPKGDHKVPLII